MSESSPTPRIVLAALSPGYASRTWTSSTILRIGRLPDQEVVLDGDSVSRRHAEVALAGDGWTVRDLGSANGTYLNGARLGRPPQRVRQGDVIKVGTLSLKVEQLRERTSAVRVGSRVVHIQASTRPPWEDTVKTADAPATPTPRHTQTLLRLMRAGYRLSHAASFDAEMQRLLDEAVAFFGAQRGGILLADEADGPLTVECLSVANGRPQPGRKLSRTPAARAFGGKESLLFADAVASPELTAADSVTRSSMASIICAVIRSPDHGFGVLHLDRGPQQEPFNKADLDLADALAAAIAVGIEWRRMAERQQDLTVQTVTALAQAVEMRDLYTGDHTGRVTTYALLLADELGLPEDQRQLLRGAAALHDIGKIAIDDQILRKPGRLSEMEFRTMKTHVTRGVQILETVPGLAWALPVVRSHHERWDGRGYPDGLAGEEIPLAARVVAVADAFDAMTSDRPYRPGMPSDEAFEEIRVAAGKQFDPECAAAFLRVRDKVEALLADEKAFHRTAGTVTDTISASELRRHATGLVPGPNGTALALGE